MPSLQSRTSIALPAAAQHSPSSLPAGAFFRLPRSTFPRPERLLPFHERQRVDEYERRRTKLQLDREVWVDAVPRRAGHEHRRPVERPLPRLFQLLVPAVPQPPDVRLRRWELLPPSLAVPVVLLLPGSPYPPTQSQPDPHGRQSTHPRRALPPQRLQGPTQVGGGTPSAADDSAPSLPPLPPRKINPGDEREDEPLSDLRKALRPSEHPEDPPENSLRRQTLRLRNVQQALLAGGQPDGARPDPQRREAIPL